MAQKHVQLNFLFKYYVSCRFFFTSNLFDAIPIVLITYLPITYRLISLGMVETEKLEKN